MLIGVVSILQVVAKAMSNASSRAGSQQVPVQMVQSMQSLHSTVGMSDGLKKAVHSWLHCDEFFGHQMQNLYEFILVM